MCKDIILFGHSYCACHVLTLTSEEEAFIKINVQKFVNHFESVVIRDNVVEFSYRQLFILFVFMQEFGSSIRLHLED